jgi:hypothetical protein
MHRGASTTVRSILTDNTFNHIRELTKPSITPFIPFNNTTYKIPFSHSSSINSGTPSTKSSESHPIFGRNTNSVPLLASLAGSLVSPLPVALLALF